MRVPPDPSVPPTWVLMSMYPGVHDYGTMWHLLVIIVYNEVHYHTCHLRPQHKNT